MAYTWWEQAKIDNSEKNIIDPIIKLGKRYKRIGLFGKNHTAEDRFAALMFEGIWAEDSYAIGYAEEKENLLAEKYTSCDLILIADVVCNSKFDVVKYKMKTTLDFGLDVFKPVFYVQFCTTDKNFDMQKNFNLMINPMPEVWKKLNVPQDKQKALRKQIFEETGM